VCAGSAAERGRVSSRYAETLFTALARRLGGVAPADVIANADLMAACIRTVPLLFWPRRSS
jgi:hypothetical protein